LGEEHDVMSSSSEQQNSDWTTGQWVSSHIGKNIGKFSGKSSKFSAVIKIGKF
jgi:hypothetical protein